MLGRPLVRPIDPTLITEEGKRTSDIYAVNFIKDKRDGRIKVRKCSASSRKHRYLKYGETVESLTVSLEALFATMVVNTNEGR